MQNTAESCLPVWLDFLAYYLPGFDSWIAIFVGACVAIIEILSRYNDEPTRIFRSYATWIYILTNSAVALFVLYIAKIVKLEINLLNPNQHPYIYSIIIAFSAMAILRSSIINIRISDQDNAPGLHSTVTKLLKWVDRIYDRQRSCQILRDIEPIIKNIPFEALSADILLTCIAAMDGISDEERKNLQASQNELAADGSLTPQAKSNHLAISIAKVTGINLLKDSVMIWRSGNEHDVSDEISSKESLLIMARSLKHELFDAGEESNGEQ